jgi:hypothetical protein
VKGLILVVGLSTLAPGKVLADEKEEQGSEERPAASDKSSKQQFPHLFDTGPHERSSMLSVFGIVPWWYGFGIGAGARYGLPIAPEGIVSTINDSVELEFGGDIWYGSWGYLGVSAHYTGIDIPAEGRWTFYLTPELAAYAKVGLGFSLRFWGSNAVGSGFSGGGLSWNTATGILYQARDSLWLRGEVGYTGLKLGVGWAF